MNEVAWLPSLLVLSAGLAIGVGAAMWLGRGRRKAAAERRQELRLRDLESRRDDLYRQLAAPDLDPGDRESLELAAARTLREIDRLAPERAAPRRAASAGAPAPPAARDETPPPGGAAAPAPTAARHPALVGFVSGMAVVLLVGGLVYLAARDAGPREEGPAGMAPPATGSPEAPHPDTSALSAEVRRELEALEAAAAAQPDDLMARKRLALGRLSAGLYFDAYRDAESILAGRPDDPDGLFIQGVVRLSMGQNDEAVGLLDRVLVNYPDHVQAMLYRGLALAQAGDLEQAIATWEMGLEAAGGRHGDLESLLQRAYAELEAPAAAPPPAAAAAPPPPAPAAPPAAAETAGPSYPVTIELAPGRAAPPGAVLFVFLRPGETGPPAAVQRIASPRFPLQLSLTAGDAMMAGTALPESGVMVARLSASGSASSRGPDDLEATAPAKVGEPVRLLLGGP